MTRVRARLGHALPAVVVALWACSGGPERMLGQPDPQPGIVDVRAHGARPDDGVDDTRAFTAALRQLSDAGGTISIPPGVYLLQASPVRGIASALDVFQRSNITLAGAGMDQTVLRMAPGSYHEDTHLILVDRSEGFVLRDLTIDGNRANVTYPDEQSHGVEVEGSSNLRFERVRFTGLRGDGIRLLGRAHGEGYPWVEDVVVESCQFVDNGRSGVAVQRAVRGLRINASTFTRIRDQAIDMEPTGRSSDDMAPRDLQITNNRFSEMGRLALTVTGLTPTDPAQRVVVADNEFDDGGIFVFNARDVWIERNVIRGNERMRPLTIEKGSESVWVLDNEIDGRAGDKEAVALLFHNGWAPRKVTLLANTILAGSGGAFYARDSEQVRIDQNEILGTGSTGVLIEDVMPGTPLADFVVERNRIEGFEVGVQFQSREDPLSNACVRDNTYAAVTSQLETKGPVTLLCLE